MSSTQRQYRTYTAIASSGEIPRTPVDGAVRARARTLIQARSFPRTLPVRRWGGPGVGTPCAVCGAAIEPSQMDIELELAPGQDGGAADHHFHVRCLAALERELREQYSA